jgi:type I restriction enzyme S subunit
MKFSGPIGELIEFAIGGGWGSEIPKDNHSRVAVIRGTDIPRITAADFTSVPFRYESDKKIVNRILSPGDIVLETAGGSSANGQYTGRTLLITQEILDVLGPTICASFCKKIVLRKDLVSPKYFYYYMQNLYKSGRVASYDSQSTGISNFQYETFVNNEYLELPPLNIQTSLATLLSNLQEKINENTRISKTLEDITQTIFRSWFIDFDPVKAKLNGEKPIGMNDETAALFPDSFEESELGLIPKGWKSGSLGDLFELQGGFAFKSSSWTDTGVPVVKIGSVKPGFIDFGQVSYVSEEFANEIPDDYRLTAGSLVVGLTGYVGEVGLARTHFPVPLINQRVAKFKSKSGYWKLPFIYCLTRNPKFKATVEELATGTAQQNVSNAQILSMPIVKPTKEVLTYFEDMLNSYFEQIINLADENETLKGLRDSLLPRLISGELEIPEEMLAS